MGWGESGPKNKDKEDFDYGIFHRGENVIESINDNMVTYTFDSPSEGGLFLEAIGWSGDSGSGAIVEQDGTKYIVGVQSNGDCCEYGNQDNYARLGGIAYQWIMDNLASIDEEVNYPADQCGIWFDPSGDGTEWDKLIAEFDGNTDGLINNSEFRTLYEDFECSNEGHANMFDRLNVNGNDVLDNEEMKEAWIYFAGAKCEYFGEGEDEEGSGGDGSGSGEEGDESVCCDSCDSDDDSCLDNCVSCDDEGDNDSRGSDDESICCDECNSYDDTCHSECVTCYDEGSDNGSGGEEDVCCDSCESSDDTCWD